VLSINAFSQFESMQFCQFSIEALWNHSLDTAAAAKLIAKHENSDLKLADEAFVAGMLHDVGKLVLAANFPGQFKQVVELLQKENIDSTAAELRVFGVNHANIGGYLLGLWGLPVPVVEAIALHHNPGQALKKIFSPLTAVHAADALVHRQQSGGVKTAFGIVDEVYLAELGLSENLRHWQAAWAGNEANQKAA